MDFIDDLNNFRKELQKLNAIIEEEVVISRERLKIIKMINEKKQAVLCSYTNINEIKEEFSILEKEKKYLLETISEKPLNEFRKDGRIRRRFKIKDSN